MNAGLGNQTTWLGLEKNIMDYVKIHHYVQGLKQFVVVFIYVLSIVLKYWSEQLMLAELVLSCIMMRSSSIRYGRSNGKPRPWCVSARSQVYVSAGLQVEIPTTRSKKTKQNTHWPGQDYGFPWGMTTSLLSKSA